MDLTINVAETILEPRTAKLNSGRIDITRSVENIFCSKKCIMQSRRENILLFFRAGSNHILRNFPCSIDHIDLLSMGNRAYFFLCFF